MGDDPSLVYLSVLSYPVVNEHTWSSTGDALSAITSFSSIVTIANGTTLGSPCLSGVSSCRDTFSLECSSRFGGGRYDKIIIGTGVFGRCGIGGVYTNGPFFPRLWGSS